MKGRGLEIRRNGCGRNWGEGKGFGNDARSLEISFENIIKRNQLAIFSSRG